MPPGQLIRLARRDPTPSGDDRPLGERDDDELMLLSRGGHAGAFDVVVRRHQRRALAVAARYLGDPSAASDAAQNAFLAIYRDRERYQARGAFASYLYRVLLNQCRMAGRAGRAEARMAAAAALEPIAASEANAEARILAGERERDLLRALDRLSARLRVVVILRYSADLSYGEIAATLDLPLGTVKRRLFDGLARLRQLMEGR